MNPVELRSILKNYNLRLEAFQLANNMGQTPAVLLAEISDNAADLFSASTVESLKILTEQPGGATKTEQQARQNLLAIARLGFLTNQTREISKEIETCQNAVRLRFQGEVLNLRQAQIKLDFEENPEARREIFIRLLEAKNSCADLRAEKFARMQEESERLGFANFKSLYEKITDLDFYNFSRKAQYFLDKTENVYLRQLSENARKTDLNEKSMHFSDFFYLRRRLNREKVFAAENLPRLYAKVLENFDFSEYKIPNILLKKTAENYQTEVFRPDPPGEIYFCFADRSGVSNYIEFLRAFGKANLAAWTSGDLTNRFPEFVFSPDAVLTKAYGFLFQTLLTEAAFLRKTLNIWDEKLLNQTKHENSFRLLFETRREISRFELETRVFSAVENLEDICETAAETFANNSGLRFEKQQMLWEISENFASLKTLRAVLFAFGLREYLRERYGFDWWQKRRAFEELIDFWNAAERYTAEEMARMIGFEMSFDLLAEQF